VAIVQAKKIYIYNLFFLFNKFRFFRNTIIMHVQTHLLFNLVKQNIASFIISKEH